VEASGDWLDRAAVVVQPAFIEHNPRPLLRALAAGIPVIATKECGIGSHPLLTAISAGSVEELTAALRIKTLGLSQQF
jgi:glycosyltransferase involved in cell wall biosynthesis